VQDLVWRHRLAVDANEVVRRLATRQALLEELRDVYAGVDVDVVGEAAAKVVNEEDLHESPPWFEERRDEVRRTSGLQSGKASALPIDVILAHSSQRALPGLQFVIHVRNGTPIAFDLLP
jgi:hypothetical protein